LKPAHRYQHINSGLASSKIIIHFFKNAAMQLNFIKHHNLWHYAGFVFGSACLLFFLADRNGYEGDDLNSIAAMFQLDAGLRGDIAVYRYPWQPLGYWIGFTVFKLTGSPSAIFLLAPLAGTITLALLVVYMSKAAAQEHGIVLYAAILVLIPELWFSGLYYNTSILAMPLVVLAVLLLYECPSSSLALLAGALAGIAVCIRLDFLLACPMLTVIAWRQNKSIKTPSLVAIATCTVLALALAFRLVALEQIMADYRQAHAEMVERAQEYGWNRYTKTWVAMIVLHPAGWFLLMVGGFVAVLNYWRNDRYLTVVYGIAALPLLYPLPNLLSVKYLLPLMVFLPVFLLHSVEQLTALLDKRFQHYVEPCIIAVAIMALVISIEPQSHAPFIRAAITDARQVGTHDGGRSFGAYLLQMLRVDRLVEVNYQQLAAEELLHFMQQQTGPDVVIAGQENYFFNGATGWRHFQLLAERDGMHGEVVDPHLLRFTFGPRHLWVSASLEKDIGRIAGAYQVTPLVIDVSNEKLTSHDVYATVQNVIRSKEINSP
jgi:hypothetical protein